VTAHNQTHLARIAELVREIRAEAVHCLDLYTSTRCDEITGLLTVLGAPVEQPAPHPWATFLESRVRCIAWMREQGHDSARIAYDLSMDAAQVERIEQARNQGNGYPSNCYWKLVGDGITQGGDIDATEDGTVLVFHVAFTSPTPAALALTMSPGAKITIEKAPGETDMTTRCVIKSEPASRVHWNATGRIRG
jgi:hypothetical protein